MGNAHIVVVDDDREIVGRASVGPQDDQIIEFAMGDLDFALHMVADCGGALLRRFEPDDWRHP